VVVGECERKRGVVIDERGSADGCNGGGVEQRRGVFVIECQGERGLVMDECWGAGGGNGKEA
jgi:hypothetical protein